MSEDDKFCPECGTPVGAGNTVSTNQTQAAPKSQDTGSIGWAVLGFLLPVVGLILWLVWRDEQPKNAHMAGVGALAAVIFSVVFVILIVVVMIGIAATVDSSLLPFI